MEDLVKKNIIFLCVALIATVLEIVTRSYYLGEVVVKLIEWFVVASPILLLIINFKEFSEAISKIKENKKTIIDPNEYLFLFITIPLFLFPTYLRIYDTYFYLSDIQSSILANGNIFQIIAFVLFFVLGSISKNKKWGVVKSIAQHIFGQYQLPAWTNIFQLSLSWVAKNRKQTAVALVTYLVLYGLLNGLTLIKIKKKQIVRDAIEDSKVSKKKKSINVYWTAPRDPEFTFEKKELKTRKFPLEISFQESPFNLKNTIKLDEIFIIKPRLKGKWTKVNDSLVKFMPDSLWEPGESYQIEINSEKLRKNISLSNSHYDFTMSKFKSNIIQQRFYVNPKDPSQKKVVSHIGFNYPVKKSSVKDKISFTVKNSEGKVLKQISGKVFLNETKTIAYIHSDLIPLKKNEQSVKFKLEKGVESSLEIKSSNNEIKDSLSIPSVYSFMNIDIQPIEIKYDKEDLPYLSLTINSNTALDKDLLKEKLSLYELPKTLSNDLKRYLNSTVPEDNYYCRFRRKSNGTYRKKNFKWTRCADFVDRAVLEKFSIRIDEYKFAESKNIDPTKHEILFDPTPKKEYFVSLGEGFTSTEGYILENDIRHVYKAPAYPKEIKLASEGAILTLNGDKKLSVYTRGIEQIEVNIRQVMFGQVQHILTMSDGNLKDPSFRNYSFDEDNISIKKKELINLDFDLRKGGYTSIDLSRYLGTRNFGGKNYGIFFVQLQDKQSGKSHEQLVVLSDMAYLIKKGRNTVKEIFVMSNSSGRPLSGVDVKLIFKNGTSKRICTTSTDGHCVMKGTSGHSAVGFTLQKGEDFIFSKLNDYDHKVNFSRFDISGEWSYKDELKAFIFSDRKLYRPGESWHLGIITKDPKWSNRYNNEKIQLEIRDSRGKTFKTKDMQINAFGFMSFEFEIPYTAPTGEYNIYIYRYSSDGYKNRIGTSEIKVQEFLPDKLKVSTQFNKVAKQTWYNSVGLKGHVTVRNLFGTPAVGNKVTSHILLKPYEIKFPKFRDYQFFNEKVLKEPKTEQLGEVSTNEEGKVTHTLDLENYKNNTFRLTFHSEAFVKTGGRSVVSQKSLLVSPHKYLIGVKKYGNLNFVTKSAKTKVHFIALSNESKKIEVKDLKLVIYEKKYQNSLIKQADGTYTYQDIKEPKHYKDVILDINESGSFYQIENSTPGDFIVKIKNNKDEVLNEFEYRVVGEADLARSLNQSSELKLELNKTDYKAGEEIQISLKAPYVGSGLITIEKDKVYAYKWFKANNATTTLSIRVPSTVEGNAYVNISMLRSKKSQKVYTSPYSFGVASFFIDQSKRTQDLEINAPTLVKPGETVTLKYRSRSNGKIVLYAVDEGILQLANYKTPNPLGHFFKKQALQVDTYQLFSLVLPSVEMVKKAFAAGGGFAEGMARSLNPFKRKFTKAVSFWSGIVPSSNKWRNYSFTVPSSFNGSLKVFGVFVNNQSVGVQTRKTLSRDNVIISPTVPTFLAPGDKATLAVSITNNLEGKLKEDNFKVTLETSGGLKVINKKLKEVRIQKGFDSVLYFDVEAQSELGNAQMKFVITYPGGKSQYIENLSVRPSTPFVRRQWRSALTKGDVEVPLGLADYYSRFFKFNLSLSQGYGALLRGSFAYLSKYPYGCTEQITSKAVPYVYISSEDLEVSPLDKEKFLATTFETLMQRQDSSGGFSLYPGGEVASDYLNLYVTKFLIMAKKNEVLVPQQLYSRALAYIKKMTQGDSDISAAQAIYLMTLAQNQTGVFAKSLAAKKLNNDLVNLYLAGTFSLLKDEKRALKHIKMVNKDFKNFSYHSDFYSFFSLRRTYLEILVRYFPDMINKELNNVVMDLIKQLKLYGGNSLWSAQLIMALASDDAYQVAKGIPVTVRFKDKTPPKTIQSENISEISKFGSKVKSLKFKITDDKPYFFSADVTGFNPLIKSFNNRVQINKRLLDLDGKPIQSLKVGEEAIVELQVQTDEEASNLVLVDLVPGGFDLVWEEWERKDFSQDTVTAKFFEKREDRFIIYTSTSTDLEKFYYKIKAVNKGVFTIPQLYGENMYKTKVKALTDTGIIKVE